MKTVRFSLFSADDLRTRWSERVEELETTVRKRNYLITIRRRDKNQGKGASFMRYRSIAQGGGNCRKVDVL